MSLQLQSGPALSMTMLSLLQANVIGTTRWHTTLFDMRAYIWSGGAASTFSKGKVTVQMPFVRLPQYEAAPLWPDRLPQSEELP